MRSWTLTTLLVAAATLPARAEDTRPRPLPGMHAVTEAPAPTGPVAADYDPWQNVNRKVFWFNDTLDQYVLEPVAKGWDFVTRSRSRTASATSSATSAFPSIW